MLKTKDVKNAVNTWIDALVEEEKPDNTVKQYQKALEHFTDFLEANDITEIDKKTIINYKSKLSEQINSIPGKKRSNQGINKVSTVNLYLVTLNKFLSDIGHSDLKVKLFKTATTFVTDSAITEKEYNRLIEWAYNLGDTRTALIMEVLALTGIRISELKFLTVETLKNREMTVTNKGKTRLVCIPKGLTKKLRAYSKENGIKSGIIFHGYKWVETDGKKELQPDYSKMLSNTSISRSMKQIAGKARGIKLEKIHPHTFRHLFAKRCRTLTNNNPYLLPLILGHSTNSVTALYVKPDKAELKQMMDELERTYKPKAKRGRKKKKPTR